MCFDYAWALVLELRSAHRRRSSLWSVPWFFLQSFLMQETVSSSNSINSSVIGVYKRCSGPRVYDCCVSALGHRSHPNITGFTWASCGGVRTIVCMFGFGSGSTEAAASFAWFGDMYMSTPGQINARSGWCRCASPYRCCLFVCAVAYKVFGELFSTETISLRADHRGDQNYWVPILDLTWLFLFR